MLWWLPVILAVAYVMLRIVGARRDCAHQQVLARFAADAPALLRAHHAADLDEDVAEGVAS